MIRQYYLHDRESVQRAINALKVLWKDELSFGSGDSLVMQVIPPGEPQSDKQRKKCHAWFGEIAMETGNTPDLVKEGMMQLFFQDEEFMFGNETLTRRKSFKTLNKKEVSYLMGQVEAWASHEGIELL